MTAETNDIEYVLPVLNYSDLRISTITTTAQLGTKIILDALFEQVPIMNYWDLNDGILKMEFNGKHKGTSFKDIMLKPKESKTSFFNQATLVIRQEIKPLIWKEINVKLFRNGGIQITGVKSIEMSSNALRWLVTYLTDSCKAKPIFEKEVTIQKEQVQLVNTDFSIGAKVRRDVLHKILSDQYRLNSSYESAIYQGVKTKYFYNAQRPANSPRGICPCAKLCKGTGDGSKIGECKKITISPFQTGQVIITGARTMAQIEEGYVFIKDVFTKHASAILRKQYVLPEQDAAPEKKTPSKRQIAGWIKHPCPRNVLKINIDAIQKL
jgi:TATA-box binding protein (TBP) (component of TFIID and TFIIIB)